MKRLALPVLAALAFGGAMLGAKVGQLPHPSGTQVTQPPTPVVKEPDAMELRTGDTFWGMSLDGVVPCSSMLVKGGGHLVSISRNSQSDRKLYFHVRGTKLIELDKQKFKLTVTGEDSVHVDRTLVEELAANVDASTN
ncbi:MAG: hypothetical protein KF708_01560 [Pirellulales bacterium]|nr:hypothetical protein [Pirellulales bacterium]